ncbi:MAG: hypothetical protein UEP57_00190 [Oscillospiraceae bacterium]|nr:hypothetical protein [Oscillospiraceae bacterium]
MQNIPDMSELLRLAQSPAGQQLMALLQQSGGRELESAVAKASAGDYTQAKQALSSLLSTPEAQALLKQLEGRK